MVQLGVVGGAVILGLILAVLVSTQRPRPMAAHLGAVKGKLLAFYLFDSEGKPTEQKALGVVEKCFEDVQGKSYEVRRIYPDSRAFIGSKKPGLLMTIGDEQIISCIGWNDNIPTLTRKEWQAVVRRSYTCVEV